MKLKMVNVAVIRDTLNTKPRHVSHVNAGINSNYRYLSHNDSTFDYRTRYTLLGEEMVDIPPIKHLAEMTIMNPSPYGYIVKVNTALTHTGVDGQRGMVVPPAPNRTVPVLDQYHEGAAYALPEHETLPYSQFNYSTLSYKPPRVSDKVYEKMTKGSTAFVANRTSGWYNPVSYTHEMNMGNKNETNYERDAFAQLGNPSEIQMESEARQQNKMFDVLPSPVGMPGQREVV